MSVILNGPLPMGFLGSKPTGTILQLRSARASSNRTFGDSRVNSTVLSSTFLVPPTLRPASVAAPTFGSLGSTMRSMENTTSSAVTGLPSCHRRPSFSLTCQTEPSALGSTVSASRLVTWTSQSHAVRPSYMMYWMAMSGSNEPVCGSAVSLDEPPTMPTMRSPPLLGVPAADAELDADVLTAAAAARRGDRPERGGGAHRGGTLEQAAAREALVVDERIELVKP